MTTDAARTEREALERRRELLRRAKARAQLGEAPEPRAAGTPAHRELPLSPGQRRMWSIQQLHPDSVAYNVLIALDLRGPLDGDALGQSLARLTARHDILRTTYHSGPDDSPVQRVRPELTAPYDQADLRRLPASEAELRTEELARSAAGHVFDLGTDSPLLVRLIRTGDETFTLVLVAHHIAWDDATSGVFFGELMEEYRGILAGSEPARGPAMQFAEAAAPETPAVPRPEGLAYWRDHLADPPPPVGLPRLSGGGGGAGRPGADQAHRLRPGTGRRIREFARREGASPFMVLLASVNALLHRRTGTRDFVIGAPVVNRDFPRAEEVVGYLGNTLALRASVSPGDTFSELVAKARTTCVGAYEHQDIELDQVAREADPHRRYGEQGLFNVVLSLRSTVLEPFTATGLTATRRHVYNGSARFDLTLAAEFIGDEVGVEANHWADDGAAAMARQLLQQLDTLIDAALERPDTPVSALELLGADERRRIVAAGLGESLPEVSGTLLPALFEAQAGRTSERTALLSPAGSLTYAELNARANRLARHLIARGIGPESLVALSVPRSTDTVVAALAVLKAGAAYVPVDPAYPSDRIRLMLTDAAPALLLTTVAAGPGLPSAEKVPRLLLDSPDTVIGLTTYSADDIGDRDRTLPLHPDHPAYVIYTSGSTGTPKGVIVAHRALAAHLEWAGRIFTGLAGHTLMHSSVSFDFSVTPMYGPLLRGGVLELCEDTLDALASAAGRASFLKITPSHLPLLPAVRFSETGPRTLVIAGEALHGEALEEWRPPRDGSVEVINEYGPTETTVGALLHALGTAEDVPPGPVPVGRPVPHTACHVLDSALSPVPDDVTGELYIGGVQLARGYLGRPGLTAGRFVASPFGSGERLYRTGDLARRRPDGTLEFVGRADGQVKIRGFRIEPGEIEAVVAAFPGVTAAAVTAHHDGPGGSYLAAYAVPSAPDAVDEAALREHLTARLPEHAVPAAIVLLDSMPLSPSGKTDRRALPAPGFTTAAPTREPRTEAERALCDLFAGLLGVEHVGVDDSFFELGGDSIVIISLVSRARAAGLPISPGDVFAHRTPAALAAAFAETVPDPARQTVAVASEDTGTAAPTPLMLAFDARPGGLLPRHHMSTLLRVPAELDLVGLTAVLQALIDHHGALRSVLEAGPRLTVRPRGDVRAGTLLHRVDVAGLPEPERTAIAEREHTAALERLDPGAGTMLQAVWHDAGPEDGRLSLLVHHLAVDGVSWRIITEDLATAWESVRADKAPQLPDVHTSLHQWTGGLGEAAHSPARSAELDLWHAVLDGPDPVLGTRRPDPALDRWSTAGTVTVTVPTSTTSALLSTVPAAYFASTEDILLTALGLAVTAWRRDRGVAEPTTLVTLEGHGREESAVPGTDLSRTVGWFTSQYPVRLDTTGVDLDEALAGGPAAGTAVKRIKEHLRSLPDRGLGYGLLRHLNADTAPTLADRPEPQIGFNYLGRFRGDTGESAAPWSFGPGGLTAASDADMPTPSAVVVNALTEDGPDGPRLTAHWTHPTGVLTTGDVTALAEHWQRALTALTAHADRPDAGGHTPSDLALVTIDQNRLDALESRWRTA
ncbi:amino acid adenylation domain-containing protein [Streptomyces griseus]|uniref:amino acid adenylation domain-containing protein n=1 Tax=Streptomyces griseus TaxID=1911 RepID=UPI00339DCDF0